MIAKRFQDLIAWQLADQLRQHIYDITESGPAARDFKFKSQIREAADSACDNTAEGFGRYFHPEFARFLTIARSSLDEVKSKLKGGLQRKYFTREQHDQGQRWAVRTHAAMMGLMHHLRTSQAPDPFSNWTDRE